MAKIEIKIKDSDGNIEEIQLTDKEKLFVEFYVESWNGADAARRAGYSENTAKEIASQNLTKIHIQKYIDHYRNELYTRNRMTIDELTHHLTETIRTDPNEIFNEDGKIKPLDQMSKRARMLIESIDYDETIMQDGDGRIVKRKIKLRSKSSAEEKLAKILGAYEKDNEQKAAKVEFYLPENNRD